MEGGVPGRDIIFIFNDVKAAEDEPVDIMDNVRARSPCLDRTPPCDPSLEYAWACTGEGAGRVATEWSDEMDVLRDG